jgi:hypothetical protein
MENDNDNLLNSKITQNYNDSNDDTPTMNNAMILKIFWRLLCPFCSNPLDL